MRGYFSVKNFERFQHYKDRNPIWIKLYYALLEDYEFCILPDASKFHLLGIFLLASHKGNRIPADVNWVAKQINATTTVDLTLLAKAGFIIIEHDLMPPLAGLSDLAITEKETETETQLQTERFTSAVADPCSHDPQSVKKLAPYPEAFSAFWREYPTDALMSKKAAHTQWKRLDQTSRDAARAAIPAFKDYCRKNPTYRTVHAQRFLSDRRFDGFTQEFLDPAAAAEAMDKADRYFKRGKYAENFR